MLVSHESPISILKESRDYNNYDYALVHLFETHPEYYNFFKDSIKMGRQVLLDNSIFELGKSFDPKKFAKYVKELKPNFYIVPDVLEDGYKTIKSFHDFVNKHTDLPGIKIGVVQGKTYDELVDCYKYMSDNADYIAISFDYSYYLVTGTGKTKLQRYASGRYKFINDLKRDGIWNDFKPHHLLGCSLAKEFSFYDNDRTIRSVDTSNPVVAGIKELRYNGNLGLEDKPSIKLADLIDHEVTDSEMEDIQYNVNEFKGIIYGN
jgi:hypothetical protein|tara:strand:- start:28 stop:816 length:789 start_codon:yes stop_codon:yes gene_type:complete